MIKDPVDFFPSPGRVGLGGEVETSVRLERAETGFDGRVGDPHFDSGDESGLEVSVGRSLLSSSLSTPLPSSSDAFRFRAGRAVVVAERLPALRGTREGNALSRAVLGALRAPLDGRGFGRLEMGAL
jgi:hypothetical protein